MPKTEKPPGGYPAFSDELAAVFLALGFQLKKGGVGQFVSEGKPKSGGGESVWMFESWSAGASAVKVQEAYEGCGDGAAPPDAYLRVNELLHEIEEITEIPTHIKARLKLAIGAICPEVAAAAIGLFSKHLIEISKAEKPLFVKVKTGRQSFEIRKAENC